MNRGFWLAALVSGILSQCIPIAPQLACRAQAGAEDSQREPLPTPVVSFHVQDGDDGLRAEVRSGIWTVVVSINSRRCRAVLDTGSTDSIVDLALARELGLDELGAAPVLDFADKQSITRLGPARIRIGSVEVSGLEVLGADLSEYSGGVAGVVSAVIGYDILRHCLVVFDGKDEAVRLLNPGEMRLDPASVHKLVLLEGLPFMAATALGEARAVEGLLMIDSGSGDLAMRLSRQVGPLTHSGIPGRRDGERRDLNGLVMEVGGFFSRRTVEVVWSPEFAIGGKLLRSGLAYVVDSPGDEYLSRLAGSHVLGNISPGRLPVNAIALDYTRNECAFVEDIIKVD